MTKKVPYISTQPLTETKKEVKGYLTQMEGESMYCIENYDIMPPFLMSIVSSSDLWMFLSSSGSLTAGRQNYNNAIFPYYTDDKIHSSSEITGPKTIIRINNGDKLLIWEPFSNRYQGLYSISRNLYKNSLGNRILFEEINHDLQIKFSYSWMNSDNIGWVRKCNLENLSSKPLDIEIADGLQNIIPYGITRDTQSMMSTLMDAYKVSEWHTKEKLALYRMSSIPIDRAEPSEALRTNYVWMYGLEAQKNLLSSKQIAQFRLGENIESEKIIYGQKTSFFAIDTFSLTPGSHKTWYMVADVAKDSSGIVALKNLINKEKDLAKFIEKSIEQSSKKLYGLVSLADGIQTTGDKLNDRRHLANVMFNIMRGGIFENNYQIDVADFVKHLEQSNKEVFLNFHDKYRSVKSPTSMKHLLEIAKDTKNKDLLRLTLEYLPLSFSRRHGDPSRPWNFFDINIKNDDGSPSLNYQGNWRDIFQNWEALAFSFPGFLPNMIYRFLNASTIDGYNPYRITREGFDWEAPEPDNPWAYIGYWGDHQIIYLLKLLELHEKFYPNQLFENFKEPTFVYANVPYRIKSYSEIIENPHDTIIFDRELHKELLKKTTDEGADGKLVSLSKGQILRVSFIEKILVSLLTKLSNFVPDAGIWLNTQRPEWNDANNALVGYGTSMVTLYHIRRFIGFFNKVISNNPNREFEISEEVISFFNAISGALRQHAKYLQKGFNENTRKAAVDSLGKAGSNYRETAYKQFSGESGEISKNELLEFFGLVLGYIDHTIAFNKRSDGLFHSYNLIEYSNSSVKVQNLQLMLEGQASVLSSGYLSVDETTKLVNSLFKSELWREEQQSFMLYPFKCLPNFLEKNIIPKEMVNKSKLLKGLLASGNKQIIVQDENGDYHFNADFNNVHELKKTLLHLPVKVNKNEEIEVCNIYESVFQHRYFTGRSGSFYKYEGLGSIYWHLVSKLLLNLGEAIMEFYLGGSKEQDLTKLTDYYYKIKEGIGAHKNPENYGAFPTDPYSHTPSIMGAQQPGMTGQVKEDILSRFMELGLTVEDGEISIQPFMLQDDVFTNNEHPELNFTFCNVPFRYVKSGNTLIRIDWKDEKEEAVIIKSSTIPANLSELVFTRSAKIKQVTISR